MTFNIVLLHTKKETENGFPIAIVVNHSFQNVKKTKMYTIGYSKINHFDRNAGMVNAKHPDYEILAPMILNYKLNARRLLYKRYTDVEVFLKDVLANPHETITFLEAANDITTEMENLAAQYGKNRDLKGQNRLKGNLKVYKNTIAQFENYSKGKLLVDIDYDLLNRFKSYQLSCGNSKATVHQYLRTIRALYRKALLKHKIPYSNPFEGVFAGLSQKSYSSKKKNISKESVVLLETAELSATHRKYVDLWLLGFYFGGADLIDIYYLYTKGYRRGRIYFERSKTDTGLPIDLKVHPKAKVIIEKYKAKDGEWLFAWEKKKEIYESFRSAYGKALRQVQQDLGIEVLPNGGYLGAKVARHTFATLGKNLLIHEDILRELMGHERNEVDNYYKDRFPEAMRDEALFKIVD